MLGELTHDIIEQVLRSQVIGRIGCHADGITYVVPITYVYDGDGIIGHSAIGMKIEMMRKNPDVCFEVEEMKSMADWKSVIAWGRFEELEGEDAAIAMRKLISHLAPIMVSETGQPHRISRQAQEPDEQGRTAVIYKIRFTRMTGRFERR